LGLTLGATTSYAQKIEMPSTPPPAAEAAPAPAPASASSAPSGTSTLRASRRKRDPFISFDMNYRQIKDVVDSRPAPEKIPLGPGFNPAAPNNSTMSLTQYKFTAMVAAIQGRNSSLAFGAAIPMRKLQASDPTVAQGSEMGGYEALGRIRLSREFVLRGGYAQRKSDTLRMHDSHNEYFGKFDFETRSTFASRVAVSGHGGPEVVMTKGKSTNGVPIEYGPQWGALGGLSVDLLLTRDAHFRFSGEFLMRRISSYKVANIEQGGAGLMTITPGVEYLLLDDFWIGAFMELPSARPIGRESVFGNTDLPGLYGKTMGLSLKAAAL